MSDETDTTSEVARVLIEHIRIGAPGHGDCSCGHVVPLGHSFAAHQAAMLAEAGLLRKATPKRIGRSPGTLYLQIEVTPHDWATRGETDDTWYEATPQQAVAALRSEANRWAAEYGLPQIATQEPAERTQGGSGDSRASGGLDGAPVDAWPFQRGAVLEWPEDPQTVVDALEEAPEGVHVIDRFRNPWRRFSKGWASPKSTSDGSAAPSSYLAGRAPITVTALADTEIEP